MSGSRVIEAGPVGREVGWRWSSSSVLVLVLGVGVLGGCLGGCWRGPVKPCRGRVGGGLIWVGSGVLFGSGLAGGRSWEPFSFSRLVSYVLFPFCLHFPIVSPMLGFRYILFVSCFFFPIVSVLFFAVCCCFVAAVFLVLVFWFPFFLRALLSF